MPRAGPEPAAWEAPPGCPPHVARLVRELVDELTATLGDALEAVVLQGSLVFGDFDPDVSDVDLLVVVAAEVDDRQLAALGRMHDAFARAHPSWDDRIEAVYVSAHALRSFRQGESPLVVISPGEPLHRTRTSPGWVAHWHLAREYGVALRGPAPRTLIAPTSHDDFEAAIRAYLPELPPRAEGSDDPRARAYAVLTVCRALYSCCERRQISKARAGRWAAQRYPEWADAIERAQRARLGRGREDDASRARAIAFVHFGVDLVLGAAPVTPEVTLRTAGAEDLEFLFELLKVSLGPYIEQTFGPWQEQAQRERFFASTRPETHQVVELGGRAIGCLLVARRPDELRLHRVFLLPEFQNRGIGSRLVRDLLAEAQAAGLPVRLRVLHVNPAQRLYRRLGFIVTGETDTHVLMEHGARG